MQEGRYIYGVDRKNMLAHEKVIEEVMKEFTIKKKYFKEAISLLKGQKNEMKGGG